MLSVSGRVPFAFLEEIPQRFVKTYARSILSAPAYAMNDEFSRILSQQMDHYPNDPNADSVLAFNHKLDFTIRSVMIDNIEKVLERGDRLSLLAEKTSTMRGNAVRFKRQSRRLKDTLWWKNVKLMYFLCIIRPHRSSLYPEQGFIDIHPPDGHLCGSCACMSRSLASFLLKVKHSVGRAL
ncbi:hypothetical protein FEM48_Zijuj01G0187900 [Ziziphus jujuba var. spinosa]|uniref:Vesicle-associated membrane protein 714 n=1 Tax=Ziziphus jujuba var. spinosa TaxID=714518 RepID=A0A978W2Y7_ZIZJJ|nr:hypothetical protein FEM48_Zijuj01G0187900 [Ziziphus jujuba var. spinosa]